MSAHPSLRSRALARVLTLALAAAALAACEYPASSRVAPNPVAYVRPAPTAPFAPDGRGGDHGLVPYVAVTIPPPTPPVTPGGQSTLGKRSPMDESQPSPLALLQKPVPAPVVTVPAYTAPVYRPPGTTQGY